MAYPGGYTGGSSAVPVASTGPALYSCPPELFAKLAAGGTLTAEEMAQITGQAPPAAPVAEAVAEAVTPAEVSSKKKKSSSSKKSKKALKASSKKSKKGCCA
eukprot:CAMPEP_0206448678 /NCGR_PEP_ID=MMETSP0324_2-20121206/17619_1 /ASSEMBLY_ACC=CAM_ASM_000836 /TAXON_ID=2866 /ORGANISM="Crypthecodinium cohnii, Strain Seligo" /LENGTH=101 /DNA_ID=CAMNT_0053917875 /DNA_START=7 /DNA_END=312 /DNA_ORIENTATION=-